MKSLWAMLNVSRYPDDPFDRIWKPLTLAFTAEISTAAAADHHYSNDQYLVPLAVMKTAAVASNSSGINFYWIYADSGVKNNEFYANLYIMELLPNTTRVFSVYVNDIVWARNITPPYLWQSFIFSTSPLEPKDTYEWTLNSTEGSQFPPILNAVEIHSPIYLLEMSTDDADVASMMEIKEWYQIKKNWMGDPCVPSAYSWNGLSCNSNRITSLNLASSSLIGEITTTFGNLSAIEYLDLSHNNLTGQIPVILAELPSLKVLDLTNNQLSEPIPDALIAKSQNGLLILRLDGNPNICDQGSFCGETSTSSSLKKSALRIIIICCIIFIILLSVVILILCRLKKSKNSRNGFYAMLWKKKLPMEVDGHEANALQLETQQFTYADLKKITHDFKRILGKGGFGTVYYGCLEDGTEVAVKLRSESSSQGTKEFLSEARHLARVHHRNLVSLIGYCNGGSYMALVYEYMSKGTLQEHLRGKERASKSLIWRDRLQIALESAQGLEYLHKGCKPPLIHRDVKTTNILLSGKLEAKIADFGQSKDFHNDVNSHISTAVAGTPGYLDPEYYTNYQISQKSDIYSFGVVLFEVITGQPPVLQGAENAHIVNWVQQRLARGNIEDIIDAELHGEYDLNSAWKFADIALKCTAPTSQQRPSISDVVMELKECLALEASSCHEFVDLSPSLNNTFTEASEISQNSVLDLKHFVEYR